MGLTRSLLAASLVGLLLPACNLLTGADDVEFSDGKTGEGGAATTGSGAGPSGSGSSTSGGPGGGSVAGSGGDGAGGDGEGGAGGTPESCGDGNCGGDETCQSCPADCGACPPGCGDGTCSLAESCETCPVDCGACGPACGGGASETTTQLDAEEQAFLVIINQYRAENGLGALTACRSMNRGAQGHSEDMRDKNYFSHTGLNGSTPWARACDACYDLGCGPKTAMAENIAAGNSGAQATFTQWKNSPGHNTNMLGANFKIIGIGRATGGGQYGTYWTNVFGGASEPSCQ